MTTTSNEDTTNLSKASQRRYNNVTLKTLTAYQLMSQRENMCELFQLLDDSERHDRIVNAHDQKQILEDMRMRLEQSKQ